MNFKDRILNKSNLWHLGAIAVFLIVACAYFSPALKGYNLNQPDITSYVGMSREVQDFRDNDDTQILWTNSMFSGMPSTQISTHYEGTWLPVSVIKILRLGTPRSISHLFIYFICFYILALSLKIKPIIGIIGSLAFGLSSYFIIILEAGHNSKATAIGLAALMIAGFIMAYRWKNWILGIALSSLFMTIEVAANHVQVTYYVAFLLIGLGIVELIKYVKEKRIFHFLKITSGLILGYGLALMVNYGNIFSTLDYAEHSIRGGTELTINANGESNESVKTTGLDREYVTRWSYGRAETLSLIIPNFKGGKYQRIVDNKSNKDILKDADSQFKKDIGERNQYWGNQPYTSGPVYIGIIVIFLAFLSLVYTKDKYKWALLSITVLTVMLSWGKNYVTPLVILPALLYLVNIFLDEKKQLVFSLANTALLFFLILAGTGELFGKSNLTDFFLDYFPGYNKFRAITIILVVAEICIPLLAILFLQRLFKHKEEIKANLKGFYIVTGSLLVLLLALMILPSSFNSFLSAQELNVLDTLTDPNQIAGYEGFYEALSQTRISIFKNDVFRAFGFLIVSGGLIFAFIKADFSKNILGIGLGVLILLDLLVVDMRYIDTEKRGKNYKQWSEQYKEKYPFLAGEGEKQILAIESQLNPDITVKVDSALKVLNESFKGEDISNKEKQAKRDYITFRMLNRNSNFRVYQEGDPFNSSYTSYFNKSIGGYHGAKLGRYQDLIEFHISRNNSAVLNMLNIKYYVRPERNNRGEISNSKLTRTNPSALGNAWLSKSIKVVDNANEEILAMHSNSSFEVTSKGTAIVYINGESSSSKIVNGTESIEILIPGAPNKIPVDVPFQSIQGQKLALISDSTGLNWIYDSAPDSLFNKVLSIGPGANNGWNPLNETIVDKRFSNNIKQTTYSGNGKIEMIKYGPDQLIYKSSSTETQLAVFSEIYYPEGWTAYIDNKEVEISRVNYVLRAIELEPGEHTIKFEFKLESFEKAKTIATIGTIAILLLLAIGLFLQFKKTEELETIDTTE